MVQTLKLLTLDLDSYIIKVVLTSRPKGIHTKKESLNYFNVQRDVHLMSMDNAFIVTKAFFSLTLPYEVTLTRFD